MVTAEEIRARVEAADKDRIQARADTAAKIAANIDKRNKVLAELAEVDAAIAAGLADSTAIMTLKELSAFTGIAVSDLTPSVATARGGRGGRQPRRRTAGAQKSRAVTASPSIAPVAVSSDF